MCFAHMGAFSQVTLILSESQRDLRPDTEENDQQSQRSTPLFQGAPSWKRITAL